MHLVRALASAAAYKHSATQPHLFVFNRHVLFLEAPFWTLCTQYQMSCNKVIEWVVFRICLYACLLCMPANALCVCLACIPDVYAWHVCLICMPYVYALYVCLICVSHRREHQKSGEPDNYNKPSPPGTNYLRGKTFLPRQLQQTIAPASSLPSHKLFTG